MSRKPVSREHAAIQPRIVALFALTAKRLAAGGIYGLVSYATSQAPASSACAWRWGPAGEAWADW